ncbi:MAG TPA: DNA primase [Rhizobiaceae bacterium]|nr:DNA primase [Rhizobiaceae bacterium]
MRFSDSFLDEIRDRVSISAVVGTRVSWDRKKTNAARGDWWACCPFHGEKTPSFHCEDRRGRYHCFGCGVSGDHFRFLTELDGMSFPEAVERVAEMAGVAMPERDPEAEKREKQRASLHDVMELAVRFFQEKLQASDGAKARAYLRDRALTPATQQAFRLGYAPDSRNALKEFLASKNVAREQMEACGLLVFGPDIPVSYDRFRDRIMFPIEDAKGRVVAFGGRALSADVPAKYLNSPETELFHKGSVLYNFARARKAQGKDGTIIAVEGYMDVIALTQAGFGNAVAPLGTALTENQLELLWRMPGEPVLCFDGDQAGLRAAWRAAELALPLIQPGRTARFALLPEGQDPDDLVRRSGKGAFAAVLEEARPLADLLWMRETQGRTFDTPERRAELDKRLRDLTSRIHDESVRFHYQQDMRERAQSFFGAPRDRFRSKNGGRENWKSRSGGASGRLTMTESLARSAMIKVIPSKPLLREAALLMALVNYPPLFHDNSDLVSALHFENPHIADLHRVIVDIYATEPAETREEVIAAIAARNLTAAIDSLSHQLKGCYHWVAGENAALEDAREGFHQAVALFSRSRELKQHSAELQSSLAEAIEAEDERLTVHLVEALKLNREEIANLEKQEALLEGFGVLSGRAGG